MHRFARLPILIAASLLVSATATPARAQVPDLDQACQDASLPDPACIGAAKLGERASAECRRIADLGGQGTPSDEQCAMPLGHRVIRSAIAAHRASWAHRALELQYALAGDVSFANAPWVGTHNSFNNTAELPTLSHTDSNQQLSLAQQLDIDVRGLELDVHWFPSVRAGGMFAPVVCHATDEHVGCSTERLLTEVLEDIAAWLNRNPDQVLLLYVEDDVGAAEGYGPAAEALRDRLRSADGRSLIYDRGLDGQACGALPLDVTRNGVLAAGAQVVIVSGCGQGSAWRSTVYDWDAPPAPGQEPVHVESRPHGYRDFPTCDQDPDGNGQPQFSRATYLTRLVRYYQDSTWVTATTADLGVAGSSSDDGITVETAGRMARCGVDLLGMDQILPDDGRLEALVWSWAEDEPAAAGDCSVQRGDGRWEARSCRERHRAACRDAGGAWTVAGKLTKYDKADEACVRAGARLAVPRTGNENAILLSSRGGGGEVWLGQRRSGDRWLPADPR